ncbi:MAG: hypothetical protein KDA89_10400 [Planctomycetaceae bacterium]|nr:hypothetical protein [Planctomycetaceae bacterium]
MSHSANPSYTLGLDLGTASLGWAMVRLSEPASGKGEPVEIIRAGVRIFEAGVEGDIEQGRDSSRAAARRTARQPRRLNWRTQNRKRTLFRLLQRHGLLPASESDRAQDRKELFDALDAQLSESWLRDASHADHQKLPYLIRARAVAEPVPAFELGRALYSLSQRRGFLSNRKAQADADEEGKVKSGISELGRALNGRTLGEFFAQEINPDAPDSSRQRIRQRYTARDMHRDEFRRIRAAQAAAFPQISAEDWNRIESAIFFQRPLKSQRFRIGKCRIDGKCSKKRCLNALEAFQQFRIWNDVQNLVIENPWELGRDAKLTLDEQQRIVDAVQAVAVMGWSKVVKAAGLPKGTKFTIQEWNTKGLVGHRTNAEMKKAFGDGWLQLPLSERDAIVRDVVYYRKDSALKARAVKAWGLSADEADELAKVRIEETHARHCEQHLRHLAEQMQHGRYYSDVRTELGGSVEGEILDILPPLNQTGLEVTNPAVIRALSELRKVVNELIREYGKPAEIRIEMARDLKNSRKRREKMHKDNEDRRKRRERAVDRILEELPNFKHSGTDIEKWLLAVECDWTCPYTDEPITPKTLLGSTPEFDVEGITKGRNH